MQLLLWFGQYFCCFNIKLIRLMRKPLLTEVMAQCIGCYIFTKYLTHIQLAYQQTP